MASGHRQKSSGGGIPGWLVWLAVILPAVILFMLWHTHEAHKKQEDEQNKPPSVRVVKPKPSPKETDLTLPGTIQAWQETPIYARTNGYLSHWYHDIGDDVKKGDLLADIDTPDVDQQLFQSQGTLKQNQANLDIARITAERYTALVKENAVSRQDADQQVANYKALQATVEAAKANVRQLTYLQSFKKLYAPFDGVVTERTIDNGALVSLGSSSRELFKVAEVDVMRIYVGVPQTEARAMQPGLKADVTLSEFADHPFTGTVTRSAREIDATARTLLTEVDVQNPDNLLIPGMYAQVRFKFPSPEPALIIPASAIVIHAEEPKVVLVGKDNKLHFVSVVIGRDYGQQTEIVKGLDKDDRMVNNPNDTLVDGEEVTVQEKQPETPKAPKEENGNKDKDSKGKSGSDSDGKGDKKDSDSGKDSGEKDKKEGTAPKKGNLDQNKTPPAGLGEDDVRDSQDALSDRYKKKPDQKSGGDKGGKPDDKKNKGGDGG